MWLRLGTGWSRRGLRGVLGVARLPAGCTAVPAESMAAIELRTTAYAVPALFRGRHGRASLELASLPFPEWSAFTRGKGSAPGGLAPYANSPVRPPRPNVPLTCSRYSARLPPGTLHIVPLLGNSVPFGHRQARSPNIPLSLEQRPLRACLWPIADGPKPVNCHPVARKTRRASSRARRPAARPGTTTAPRPQAAPVPGQGQAPAVGGDQAFIRSVEMTLAPSAPPRRPGARARGGRIVLETADPAIPLDRVPFFLTDLARLGIVAGMMVVLLVLAALFVIPLVVR